MLSKDEDIAALVDALRARLAEMRSVDRLDLFWTIMDGYCKDCGSELPNNRRCYCMRDD